VQVDLRETRAAIVREQDALAVLGAEWARVTQPARIQALSQKHLPLSDVPVAQVSSLSQLPHKAPPITPDSGFAVVKAVAPEKHVTRKAGKSPARTENVTFAAINTGT
jgi:hypothetical protein